MAPSQPKLERRVPGTFRDRHRFELATGYLSIVAFVPIQILGIIMHLRHSPLRGVFTPCGYVPDIERYSIDGCTYHHMNYGEPI